MSRNAMLLRTVSLALVVVVCLFLAYGCATTVPVAKVVKTDVVVSAPCKVAPVEVPIWPLDSVDPKADVHTLAKNALAEVERRAGYETKLLAAAKACQ